MARAEQMSVLRRSSSVVRRQQLLQRTSPPKVLARFDLTGMILLWLSLIIVQMVPVCCISRSHWGHMFNICLHRDNMSETTSPRALIFGM